MNGNVPDLSKLNQRIFSGVAPGAIIRHLNDQGLFEAAGSQTDPTTGQTIAVVGRMNVMDAEDLIAAIRQEVHEELQVVLQEFKRAVAEVFLDNRRRDHDTRREVPPLLPTERPQRRIR